MKKEEIYNAKNRRKLQIKTINNSELREGIPTIYLKSEQTEYYEKFKKPLEIKNDSRYEKVNKGNKKAQWWKIIGIIQG